MHPTRAKGQCRAIREGFLEAEEEKLTKKGDEVSTRQESALSTPLLWELPALGLGLHSPLP